MPVTVRGATDTTDAIQAPGRKKSLVNKLDGSGPVIAGKLLARKWQSTT
jgi:hypothetical protein